MALTKSGDIKPEGRISRRDEHAEKKRLEAEVKATEEAK